MTTETDRAEWRRFLVPSLTLFALVAGVVFTWYSAHSLLMLFAGILFAVFLDACTRGLGHILPVARAWRFSLVVFVLAALAVLLIAWGIIRLPAQARMLMQVMDTQLTVLETYLATFGIDLFGPGGRNDLSQFIADPGRLFGHVQYAVSGAYVFVITTIVIVCLGLFFASQDARQRGLGGGAQQRPELRRAVDVEQHEFAAVGRQVRVECRDDRRGADREIHDGLEGQHWRQALEHAVARVGCDLLLQRAREPERLARPVHGEGVVLERIELRHHAEPRGLGEGGEIAGQPREPAKRAKLVMPIIGEISTSRSARGLRVLKASSADFIASAPPLEKPTMCSGAEGPTRLRASRRRGGWPPASPPIRRR